MRLLARPDPAAEPALPPGTSPVQLANGATGALRVPSGPARGLVVCLHGAGGSAAEGLTLLESRADEQGLLLLAPASVASTWGPVRGGSDPDTPALDTALRELFARYPVDPARVAVAGFSDGASYALSLGLENGDLFGQVVAFSPGYEAATTRRGRARFLITHGTHDRVLPVARCGRRVAADLQAEGFGVDYREFDGEHVVPPDLALAAAEWLATG